MKSKKSLDKIDKSLLHILQCEGRISAIKLAKMVRLGKSPCISRVRWLESSGYISGYQARLNPQKINLGHLVYVQVKLESTASSLLQDFNKAVTAIPEIMSCDFLSGGYDYLLKIRTKDMSTYRTLLGDVISTLPGVTQTASFPVMEEIKDSPLLAIDGR